MNHYFRNLSNFLCDLIASVVIDATTPEVGHAVVSHLDLSFFLANVGGSGVGGAILTAIVTYIKSACCHK